MLRKMVVVTLLSGGIAGAAMQTDTLAALGTNLREAQDAIFSSFATGNVAVTGERKAFYAASPEQRAVIVRTTVGIARTFTESEAFARRYALYRETQRPKGEQTARTGDEARAQQQEAIDLAVKQALAQADQLPAQARKQLEASIAEMRRQVAELNADAGYRAQVDAATAAAAKESDADLARRMATFESEFPERAETLVGRRLRQFLLACGEVDFAAKLETTPDKTTRFENAAYERRSPEWKMCYRAGKPAVDAARRAAEEWLKVLTEKGF